jgi:hypothetical protein
VAGGYVRTDRGRPFLTGKRTSECMAPRLMFGCDGRTMAVRVKPTGESSSAWIVVAGPGLGSVGRSVLLRHESAAIVQKDLSAVPAGESLMVVPGGGPRKSFALACAGGGFGVSLVQLAGLRDDAWQ